MKTFLKRKNMIAKLMQQCQWTAQKLNFTRIQKENID